jgi:beta-galactosidase
MLTAYSTTLVADGKDETLLRIAVTDSVGREITGASDTIRIYLEGDARVTSRDGKPLETGVDSAGLAYLVDRLDKGYMHLILKAGTTAGKIRAEARSGNLWPAGHEIHTLPAGFEMMEPTPEQDAPPRTMTIKMVGADISFLPQLESRGRIFYDGGIEKDAIGLLRDHGINTIRLRIFVNPENEKGYAPGEGFCGLEHTLGMAARVKAAGMKLLLDFHYSDYWADPQQQYKPLAWEGLDTGTLADSVREYTSDVLRALEKQGTSPDMVQIGNEINHGILWPDGHISNPDQLVRLLMAGVEGTERVDPRIPVMMHIALGGQNEESVFWLDNMIARDLRFDIIGISYYPRWHGTLDDLNANLHDLVKRYRKPVNVVEYGSFTREVHEIVFNLPDGMGWGTCVWEPLGGRGDLFDRSGNATDLIHVYEEIRDRYL